MPTTRTFLYTDNKRLRLVNTDVDAAVLTTSSSEVATLQSDVITAQNTADACLPLSGGTLTGNLTVSGTTQFSGALNVGVIGSTTPYTNLAGGLRVVGCIDVDCASIGSSVGSSGNAYVFSSTTGTTVVGGGAVALGVANSLTTVRGNLSVVGGAQVRRIFCLPTSNNKIEFVAGPTIGGSFTSPIRMFDNAGSTIRIGGGGSSTVQVNVLSETSDRALKEDIQPIADAGRILQIPAVSWLWKRNPGDPEDTPRYRSAGVVAQDVESIIPEAIRTRDDGVKSIQYNHLLALLIKHTQELTARVAVLEAAP